MYFSGVLSQATDPEGENEGHSPVRVGCSAGGPGSPPFGREFSPIPTKASHLIVTSSLFSKS